MTTLAQQIADRDTLVRAAMAPVNLFAINNHDALKQASSAVNNDLIVRAAVGFLIGTGFITVSADLPEWYSPTIPEHLMPDVGGAIAANREVRDAIFPNGLPT